MTVTLLPETLQEPQALVFIPAADVSDANARKAAGLPATGRSHVRGQMATKSNAQGTGRDTGSLPFLALPGSRAEMAAP